jgi:hypothetical protein
MNKVSMTIVTSTAKSSPNRSIRFVFPSQTVSMLVADPLVVPVEAG